MTTILENVENAGQAFWAQKDRLANASPRLHALAEAVGRPTDLDLAQYSQLFTIVLQFKPTFILELGRGWGNSTCVLTEAANQLGDCHVVSVCLSNDWQTKIRSRVSTVVSSAWFDHLDARIANIFDIDIQTLFINKTRILFLWDAHGWDVAEYVLAEILPLMRNKEHLVLAHDIQAFDPQIMTPSYAEKGIWKGEYKEDGDNPFVTVNGMASVFEEVIPLADFSSRNKLEIHSVENELREYFSKWPERNLTLHQLVGEEMISPSSSFQWFTLNSIPTHQIIYFPKFRPTGEEADRTSQEERSFLHALASDLQRLNWRGRPTLATFALICAKKLLGWYERASQV